MWAYKVKPTKDGATPWVKNCQKLLTILPSCFYLCQKGQGKERLLETKGLEPLDKAFVGRCWQSMVTWQGGDGEDLASLSALPLMHWCSLSAESNRNLEGKEARTCQPPRGHSRWRRIKSGFLRANENYLSWTCFFFFLSLYNPIMISWYCVLGL